MGLANETPELPTSTCHEVASFFIGRRREIYHAYRALVENYRVVSLTGLPGIGKSQVALACAAYCRERHLFDAILFWEIDNDTCFDELTYVKQLYDVFSLESSTRGVGLDPALASIKDDCAKRKDRKVLLILNGIADGTAENAEFFRKLIDGLIKKTRVNVLATSREELASPDRADRVVQIGPLKDIHAAEIFAKRSPRSLSNNELIQFETDVVCNNPLVSFSKTEIIQRLRGNPLIIERVAKETASHNLLLNQTDFIMIIIPRVVTEVLPDPCDLPAPPTHALARSISERPVEHSGPGAGRLKRATSECNRGAVSVSPSKLFGGHANYAASHVYGSDVLTEADVDLCLADAHLEILGKDRPLTPEDVLFLKKKLNCNEHNPVSQDSFKSFLKWYTQLLDCFLRSELWCVPGCIYGFINRTQAEKILSALPNEPSTKVSSIRTISPFLI
jgi:hypothetical protein